jgi:hypothetical protein
VWTDEHGTVIVTFVDGKVHGRSWMGVRPGLPDFVDDWLRWVRWLVGW